MIINKPVMIIGCLPSSLVNFRGDLIATLVDKVGEVVALSAHCNEKQTFEIEESGCCHIGFSVTRTGLSPIEDIKTLIDLIRIQIKFRPRCVLAYTIKPVIWGGIAARFTRAPFVPLITGLGFAFQGGSFRRQVLKRVVEYLYKVALKRSEVVIFQNNDNAELFIAAGIVDRVRAKVVAGSGVNTVNFSQQPLSFSGPVVGLQFLCVARLLSEKGLREYAEASAIVSKNYPSARFRLVGPLDESPDGISLEEVSSWENIEYVGAVGDVRPFIAESHVYVLPSYHEGLPRSTLEAMSMGRPVITTNAVGCKETVKEGWNGFKVNVGSAEELAERMIWCIEHSDQLQSMGDNSRAYVEERFDVRIVNDQILEAMGLNCEAHN